MIHSCAWHDTFIHWFGWRKSHIALALQLSPRKWETIYLAQLQKMVFTHQGDGVGACTCQCIWITNYLYASRTVNVRHKLWHEQIPTSGVRVRWWVKEVPRIRAPHIHHNHCHTVLTCAYIAYGYFLFLSSHLWIYYTPQQTTVIVRSPVHIVRIHVYMGTCICMIFVYAHVYVCG